MSGGLTQQGAPPFNPHPDPKQKGKAVPAVHVPLRPLRHANLDWCPWAQPGDIVIDDCGRWCIVVNE